LLFVIFIAVLFVKLGIGVLVGGFVFGSGQLEVAIVFDLEIMS
jgi:hypothetical protein